MRPEIDIVVPMYAPYMRKTLVSPFNQKRNITVLLRFKVDNTDGKYLLANHGVPALTYYPGVACRVVATAMPATGSADCLEQQGSGPAQPSLQLGLWHKCTKHGRGTWLACEVSALVPAGHRLRYELEESWAKDPVQGSDLGVKNVLQTEADMRNSIFCVCSPGTGLLLRA